MAEDHSVYDDIGVPTAINAAGTKTRVGGPPIRPEAADAMRRAASASAHVSDLQARASERISDATHAEAGYVVSGASAGLTMAAASCIARSDYGTMAELPNPDDVPDEIVLPRSQRNSYDRAFETAGATVVDVGNNDQTLGIASTNVHPWEIEEAITDRTAAIAHVPKERTQLSLSSVVEVAREHDLPVIVDAAATLPPRSNLPRFVEEGADLVVFSGGKAIRGPQSTGIVAGRRDLIGSIALQHLDMDVVDAVWDPPDAIVGAVETPGVPRMGIGRGFKVSKEAIVGLVRALELFVDEDDRELHAELLDRARRVVARLEDAAALDVTIRDSAPGDDEAFTRRSEVVPSVVVRVDESKIDGDTRALVTRLRNEHPRIFVGTGGIDEAWFTIDPFSLSDAGVESLSDRILDNL